MSKLAELGARLYQGDASIDFIGRRKLWYLISALIVLVVLAGLGLRGLNFGIEFRGGSEFRGTGFTGASNSVEEVTEAVIDAEISGAESPTVVAEGSPPDTIRVETETLSADEQTVIKQTIIDAGATEVSSTSIGPTWGSAIANKALTGLAVFLVLVVLFIWAYFREWRMSVAAIVALAHDLIITIGVYALTGFEVTPATVTGLLTILGFSLYDTVVVFDKVRENTRGIANSTRRTYAESANLAVNQTLVRSINTSIAALIPVGAILYVGIVQLGSGPLKDLALALFVGMAAGAYSSIFIATPLLTQLKMREPAMQVQAKRVAARRSSSARDSARLAEGEVVRVESSAQADLYPVVDGAADPDRDPAALVPAAGSTAVGSGSTAVGSGSTATRPGSTAVGSGSTAVGSGSTMPTAAVRPARTGSARPMSASAAKRAQPQRQVRSKRGKSK
ncbi:MAG: protein translocase subunit SecF [Actinomycetota bacterium]|nr:protein translocase subunit SecF [Actinomycetota bacterium]